VHCLRFLQKVSMFGSLPILSVEVNECCYGSFRTDGHFVLVQERACIQVLLQSLSQGLQVARLNLEGGCSHGDAS
jgi:hypothetical protein